MSYNGFAVIDFETTGLFINQGDRAIQLAIVLLDQQGEIQTKWMSYVNPEGRKSHWQAAKTHQIPEHVLQQAPKFVDLAPTINHLLANRVITAHKVEFDYNVLKKEFSRINRPFGPYQTFCTMMNATQFIPGLKGVSLQACLDAINVTNNNPHEALSDALSTAELLKYYLKKNPNYFKQF